MHVLVPCGVCCAKRNSTERLPFFSSHLKCPSLYFWFLVVLHDKRCVLLHHVHLGDIYQYYIYIVLVKEIFNSLSRPNLVTWFLWWDGHLSVIPLVTNKDKWGLCIKMLLSSANGIALSSIQVEWNGVCDYDGIWQKNINCILQITNHALQIQITNYKMEIKNCTVPNYKLRIPS